MKALLIDIDGLRSDVFSAALEQNRLPEISRLLHGAEDNKEIQIPALAPAPSITFSSQASLFTGSHPSQHCIPGNQFFDRFGVHSDGQPSFYAFDIGDTLEVADAVSVFTVGLASDCLNVPTIYERFSDWGWSSVVAGNMYAKGADFWLKPSMVNLARFSKGGNLFGLSSSDFDEYMVNLALGHLQKHGLPDVLTIYLLGLDHISHKFGPGAQLDYLCSVVDPLIGRLWDTILSMRADDKIVVSVFSDHGQVQVIPDDTHALQLAFPFDRELSHFFTSLGLDVHNYPGEDPACDAVAALNGGLAHIYLQNRDGKWCDQPIFTRDILPVAKALWEAHNDGKYSQELEGALSGVLVRDAQNSGWHAPYLAFTPDHKIIPLEDWFSRDTQRRYAHIPQSYIDPVNRINNLASPFVGDLLILSNYSDGYYFGSPTTGVHGGLHPEESQAVMVFGFPGYGKDAIKEMRIAVSNAINQRCQIESNRQPSTSDLLTGLLSVLKK